MNWSLASSKLCMLTGHYIYTYGTQPKSRVEDSAHCGSSECPAQLEKRVWNVASRSYQSHCCLYAWRDDSVTSASCLSFFSTPNSFVRLDVSALGMGLIAVLLLCSENSRRAALLRQWKEAGGVMLIGYAAFRNLALGKHVKDSSIWEEFCQALQVIFWMWRVAHNLLVCFS